MDEVQECYRDTTEEYREVGPLVVSFGRQDGDGDEIGGGNKWTDGRERLSSARKMGAYRDAGGKARRESGMRGEGRDYLFGGSDRE